MIKVFELVCIKPLIYDKTVFVDGETYVGYKGDTGIAVINGEERKGFCDMDTCMYRHGHPYGFQKFFEIVKTGAVQNKKELREYIRLWNEK